MQLTESDLLKVNSLVRAEPINTVQYTALRWDGKTQTLSTLKIYTENRLKPRVLSTMYLEFSYRAPGYTPTNHLININDFFVFTCDSKAIPKSLYIIPFYEFTKTFRYYELGEIVP
jgi:hypothetical protein